MQETVQFEDALEVVQWLDDMTGPETNIMLKTDLTTVIFEIHLDNGVVYDVSVDIYDEPSNDRFSVYDRDAGQSLYTVGA